MVNTGKVINAVKNNKANNKTAGKKAQSSSSSSNSDSSDTSSSEGGGFFRRSTAADQHLTYSSFSTSESNLTPLPPVAISNDLSGLMLNGNVINLSILNQIEV